MGKVTQVQCKLCNAQCAQCILCNLLSICREEEAEQGGTAVAQILEIYYNVYNDTLSSPLRALRALGLLLADGTPTGGRGEDFLSRQPDFFTETAVTPERKVEKSFPRWEINRHVEG